MTIVMFFLLYKLTDFFTSFFSLEFIKNLGWFPYQDLINGYHLPAFLTAFANFDGAHYIAIATRGYAQYEQAFFPLYPLLIKINAPLFGNNHLLTGLIISNISFVIGLFVFKKYLDLLSCCHCEDPDVTSGDKAIPMQRRINLTGSPRAKALAMTSTNIWPILLLLVFPTSFFFGTVYTEGLFFMFVILTFYFLKKERYFLAGIFAFLASLTRLVGVFLVIPIVISLIKNKLNILSFRTEGSEVRNLVKRNGAIARFLAIARNDIGLTIPICLPLLGLGFYSLYLFVTTGDFLYFFHAQSSFGLNRSTELILFPQVYFRYFKIFLTSQHNFQYFIALFEFMVFSFVLVILTLDLRKILLNVIARKRSDRSNPNKVRPSLTGLLHFVRNDIDRLGLNLFSFANLLLPAFTGTFLSIPRFALLSLSMFIFLGEIQNKWIKSLIMSVFILFHIIIFSFFSRGYFVS